MLPVDTAVKVDDPETPKFHGKNGFIRFNHKSGIVSKCSDCQSIRECRKSDCTDGEELPKNWYVLVFDPMDAGGFQHCQHWFNEDDLVINGC